MATPNLDEEAIFNAARRLSAPEERRRYLEEACGTDQALRARVEALLRIFEQEQSFLEAPAATLRAPREAFATEGPGTQIGPYKLLEIIGEGGFGTVFMAEQQQPLRRTVAQPKAAPKVRQNLALVVGLRGNFAEAEKIARADLPDDEAAANVGYLRQMLSQQNEWKKMGRRPNVPAPDAGT